MEKGRILIDSNIIVSAIVFDANELKVLTVAREKGYTLLVSEHVLDEVNHVLEEKFPNHVDLVRTFVRLADFRVVESADYIHLRGAYPFIEHQKDWHVLAAAEISESFLVVSGDKALHRASLEMNIKIVNSKSAIEMMII